ncbi:MAG: hypothetical protein SFU86_07815 [Pirellulaceae bacterium]|nr:hypothetical protein [Pirellulaceae bacterium]
MRITSPTSRPLLLLLGLALLPAATGCGIASQMAYWMYGNTNPAKFDGLEGKRVAVVCLDANSLKGPGSEADSIARQVSIILGYNVANIDMVRQTEIADWMDNNEQDLADYRDIGRGVKADMVVGIDLESFSIHEGQTLLKGRARVGTKVYDMQRDGEVAYQSPPHEIRWPETGARHVTENEANFRTVFIHTLAQKIARDFYAYDKVEDYGLDAAFQGD